MIQINLSHTRKLFVLIFIFLFGTHIVSAATVSITPNSVVQGEPIMITLSDTRILPIKSTPNLFFFLYKGVPTALYGTDINQKVGTTSITITLKDGSQISDSFLITSRIHQQESLPIPAQLGGNSVSNQIAVVSKLSLDNAELNAVYSRKDKALWTNIFSYPVIGNISITDPYGYNRDSGAATITHKGVDFHAPTGTKVYAINRGVVRVAKTYTVYGKTIIVDHGLGLLSMYMHLSKIYVAEGNLVQKGELIGLSGETGYSEGPHLHLTIRINNISIDPIKFFELFKK